MHSDKMISFYSPTFNSKTTDKGTNYSAPLSVIVFTYAYSFS